METKRIQLIRFSKVKVLILFLSLILSFNLNAYDKPRAPEAVPGATIVLAEEVVDMILTNPKLIIIDSRKRTEYIKGHIEGAVNILNTEMMMEDLESIASDKTTALLFYCNGTLCIRSANAVTKAVDWGYTNIYWFRDGWKAWTEKKLPMVID